MSENAFLEDDNRTLFHFVNDINIFYLSNV